MRPALWRARDPFNGGLMQLKEEMDKTFQRFVEEPLGWTEPGSWRTEGWLPAIDVSETDAEVVVRAEVPGVPVKDLDISVTGNTLTISGKKEEQAEKKGENFYQCERRFGAFQRLIDLPETADPDKITAESDSGVIVVRVAKKPGVKPKHVEVKSVVKKVPVSV